MSFIIEVLPKKENSQVLVFVVRAQNGFPIAVCDSLDQAKDVISEQVEKALATTSNAD